MPAAVRPVRADRSRLKRESSADQVAAHIRRAIIDGELRTGDRLPRDEIADELGVSRIPVREAIIALDREGWVRLEPNRGAYVTGLSADDIRDHYELRGYVFGLVVRRVAQSASDAQLAELAVRAKALQRTHDLGAFRALNERFLAKLVGIADSPRLRAALLVTPTIVPTDDYFEIVPDGRDVQARGIAKVMKLVAARRDEDADDAMRETLRRHADAVISALAHTALDHSASAEDQAR